MRQVICRYASVFCTLVHKDEIDAFHDHLNEQNADIQFTKDIEDSVQKTDAYRQITWRIILQLDFTQSHDNKDFEMSATSLWYTDSLRDENKYLERVFIKTNNYKADFIRRNIFRPTEAEATNKNPTPVTTVTTPYIKDTSETISRTLQPYNIRVANEPTTTLLTNV